MAEMNVHKITLSTGKVVYLRDPEMKHVNLATEAAAQSGSENKFVFSNRMQQELLKLLVVQIDDKQLTAVDKEQVSKYLTLAEYGQCLVYLSSVTGDQGMGKPQVEMVSFGDK